jgi:hypothetical protein
MEESLSDRLPFRWLLASPAVVLPARCAWRCACVDVVAVSVLCAWLPCAAAAARRVWTVGPEATSATLGGVW